MATMDGQIAFATVSDSEIAAGELQVDVAALCTTSGAQATGLVPGQVTQLVDPIPYVVSVSNAATSVEGADVEDDERLRERIRLAPETYTVAGSTGAYEARVLAVSADIGAVSVTSPEPGVVDVRFVLAGGELPDEAMISMVREALSDETVRPLTDRVDVAAPETVDYAVSGRWYLRRSDAVLLSGVTAAVAQAVEDWRLWQRSQPGRDINPTRLIAAVQAAGAKRVELDAPAFRALEGHAGGPRDRYFPAVRRAGGVSDGPPTWNYALPRAAARFPERRCLHPRRRCRAGHRAGCDDARRSRACCCTPAWRPGASSAWRCWSSAAAWSWPGLARSCPAAGCRPDLMGEASAWIWLGSLLLLRRRGSPAWAVRDGAGGRLPAVLPHGHPPVVGV